MEALGRITTTCSNGFKLDLCVRQQQVETTLVYLRVDGTKGKFRMKMEETRFESYFFPSTLSHARMDGQNPPVITTGLAAIVCDRECAFCIFLSSHP